MPRKQAPAGFLYNTMASQIPFANSFALVSESKKLQGEILRFACDQVSH